VNVLKDTDDIIILIKEDKWIMDILQTVSTLNLPDWWVCAGFVRSKIWDVLHEFDDRTPMPDIDVIYYDNSTVSEEEEKKLERRLKEINPSIPWSVKNQARMHVVNNIPPYTSSVDAISKFPETATALGLKVSNSGEVVLTAPYGVEDVINLLVKPTPYFQETEERAAIYEKRIREKNWSAIWDKLEIHHTEWLSDERN
jgi:hypothetical protein